MTFEDLMSLARQALAPVEEAPAQLPEPLVYVLLSAGGNVYSVINDRFDEAIRALQADRDTAVRKVLTMWKSGTIDLPSYAFRSALLNLNTDNGNTELLVQGDAGRFVKRLGNTM